MQREEPGAVVLTWFSHGFPNYYNYEINSKKETTYIVMLFESFQSINKEQSRPLFAKNVNGFSQLNSAR